MSTVHLPKKFGLLNAISINMSNMVGTGPFITVPAILATMGGPQALVCWFVGAVIAIADGLVFAELGTTFPSSGGSYTYLRQCFGRDGLGRLIMAVRLAVLFSATTGYHRNRGMALYTGFVFKGLVSRPWAMRSLAAGFALAAMFLLYRKIRDIARIMLVLWSGLPGDQPLGEVEGESIETTPAFRFSARNLSPESGVHAGRAAGPCCGDV